jgi:tetratricopeptide (TPR) repeat protein
MRPKALVLSVALLIGAVTTLPAQHETHPAEPTAAVSPDLYDDLGTFTRKVSTSVPKAQSYFDQGMRLVWAFNHDEAKRAFEEAARLDPSCAMCRWGVALTLGPNINLPALPDRAAAAVVAAKKAGELAKSRKATPVERALIAALARRYSDPPPADPADQKKLDDAYAAAMRDVARRFPNDLDVATLYAESMMDLRPWDLWTNDGKPQQGTLQIVSTLERVLAKNPRHPGANHYYIHAVEASPNPGSALAAAKRIGSMMPGAGHLVHMPSHIYIRTGDYEASSEANRRAIDADAKSSVAAPPSPIYQMYVAHNHQFLWASAMLQGRSAESLESARKTVENAPLEMLREMPGFDTVLTYPILALVRFGRWDDVLKEPAPPADFPFANAIHNYARGVAFAKLGRADEASAERQTVSEIATKIPPDAMESLNKAHDLLDVAASVLDGQILAKKGDFDGAVSNLTKAAQAQDALKYAEPPDWYYPVRQTLGAVLLSAGRAKDAERVYREDLVRMPDNGWSLLGLAEALKAQGKPEAETRARFEKAWQRADTRITASDF